MVVPLANAPHAHSTQHGNGSYTGERPPWIGHNPARRWGGSATTRGFSSAPHSTPTLIPSSAAPAHPPISGIVSPFEEPQRRGNPRIAGQGWQALGRHEERLLTHPRDALATRRNVENRVRGQEDA